MSASGSHLSSNTRIEPAVALKASERPDRSSVCFVVESGGRRCGSAADGDVGDAFCALPPRPPFWPVGAAASERGCGGSSARPNHASAKTDTASTRVARRSAGKLVTMIVLLARPCEPALTERLARNYDSLGDQGSVAA